MRLCLLPKNDSRLLRDQQGSASIYVSFIIMVILSLLALTFAKIMTDRYIEIAESQYDLQAHYAAESAINSVRATIHKGLRDREQVSDAAVDVTVEPTGGVVGANSNPAPSSCTSGGYGAALDVEGDILAVGAPTAGTFGNVCLSTKKSDALDWLSANLDKPAESVSSLLALEQPDNDSSFGSAVALSQNGNILAVGAPGDRSGRGSVYIFRYQSGSWGFQTKIIPGSGDSSEQALLNAGELSELPSIIHATSNFGSALEWHEGVLLVGAPSENTVYGLENNTWTLEGSITPGLTAFGSIITSASVRFSEKNGQNASLAVGADANEMIYLYEGWQAPSPNRFCAYTTGSTSSSNCFGKADHNLNPVTDFDFSGGILAVGYSADNSVDILEREGPDWKKKYRVMNDSFASPPLPWKKVGVTGASSKMGQAVSLVQMQDNDRLLIIGDPGSNKIHFFTIKSNDILNDIWASGLDQDCPDGEDVHEAWRNSRLSEAAEFENIHYTCVSVEVDPESLIYDHISTDRSLVLPLEPVDGDTYEAKDLGSLSFEWDHIDGSDDFKDPTTDKFPDTDAWGPKTIPVLRVQITPVNLDPKTMFDRDDLNDATRVFFFYPTEPSTASNMAGSVAWPVINADGEITEGICTSGKALSCEVTITEMPKTPAGSLPGSMVYFTRIQSIYQPTQLRIKGRLSGTVLTSDPDAHFKNIQAVITATGWSSHVAQRIRERIPLRPIYDLPEYGIDSAEDFCKILVTTGYTGVYLDTERDEAVRKDSSCSLKTEHQNDSGP